MNGYLSRESIRAAIKKTEYKYFGDYEMSDDQRCAVDVLVEVAEKYLAADEGRDGKRPPQSSASSGLISHEENELWLRTRSPIPRMS